ncbi:MAG: transposase [Sphingobacteriales bacterium]|nr:MAG: transposase [Sphingobacteriales bacterium]
MCNEMDEIDFLQTFADEEGCKEFLYKLKWKNGFICRRCGSKEFWKGRTRFHARCRKCGYDESLTAHTIFQKIHIPLVKAFSIIYHVVVYKKGRSTLDLSRTISVSQKSVWYFKRKLQEVMGADVSEEGLLSLTKKAGIVDGLILTRRGKKLDGLQRVILGPGTSFEKLSAPVTKVNTAISEPEIFEPCHLVGGRYVDEGKSIYYYNFRSWLTGIHHHCSAKYLQGYFDEFNFRFTYRRDGLKIWYRFLTTAMRCRPFDLAGNGAKSNNRV